jgi:hypothetical protein
MGQTNTEKIFKDYQKVLTQIKMQRLRLYYPKEGNTPQKIGNRIGGCFVYG